MMMKGKRSLFCHEGVIFSLAGVSVAAAGRHTLAPGPGIRDQYAILFYAPVPVAPSNKQPARNKARFHSKSGGWKTQRHNT